MHATVFLLIELLHPHSVPAPLTLLVLSFLSATAIVMAAVAEAVLAVAENDEVCMF